MSCRVALLAFAAAGCAQAKAPDARSSFATALAIPVSGVLDATPVEVNRQVVAFAGRYTQGGRAVAALVTPDRVRRPLGDATDLRFVGLVDLAKTSTISLGLRRSVRLETRGMKRPTLAWVTRHKEKVDASPKGGLGRDTGGVRESEVLHLLDFGLRVVLRLEIKLRSADGYGGFTVGRLRLEHHDGKTLLTTTRQDRLPASRSHCLKPEPVDLVFELTDGHFRERRSNALPSPPACR